MQTVLIVTNDFHDYKKGAEITDPDKIAEILGSEFHVNVVKTSRAEEDAGTH